MIQYTSNNPFVECTARDMEYSDVVKYWCSPFSYYRGLEENILFNSMTPIIIEGARGSGKTMILKYLSYFCQREEITHSSSSEIIAHFKKVGSIGIYYRFKNDFGKLLNILNCSIANKKILFTGYFQLYYSREILKVIDDLSAINAITNQESASILEDINSSLGILALKIEDAIFAVNKKIEEIDKLINKMKYLSDINEKIAALTINDQTIIIICKSIRKNIIAFKNVKVLLLIDEYENISGFQDVTNTMIKQTDAYDGITYRIGMRPEGMTTRSTNVGKEFLEINRDYLLIPLTITEPKKFQQFIKSVAEKRLISSRFFADNKLLDIEKLLGVREDWVEEARNAVKNRPEQLFELLKLSNSKKGDIDSIINAIQFPDNPLIEMLNILWINRGRTSTETHDAMQAYNNSSNKLELRNRDKLAYKYMLDYSMKYKYSSLFVLLAYYKVPKKYYSFTTFSYLASGSVNDFISLCRNTFARLDKKCLNDLQINGRIPIEYQDKGAQDSAMEQLDKIRLCEDSGMEMYTFVMNMGGVFNYYHRDAAMQYPETNQFAFENEAEIEYRDLLCNIKKYMIKWGVIEKKPRKQSISIGKRKGDIYILNRLITPIFQISYRTRGGYNFIVETKIFERMLFNNVEAKEIIQFGKKKAAIDKTKKQLNNTGLHQQISFNIDELNL